MDYEYIDYSATNETVQERKERRTKLPKNDDEKPHKCAFCGKGFSKTNHLKSHVAQIHEDKKPWECKFCDFKSNVKRHMTEHIEQAHEEKKSPRCEKEKVTKRS